ncbi:MAG: hypothetical protein IKY33_01685 [Clostridia bacterium]|nr:hypothetical protein [Clostridia bacterium]
MAVKTPEYWKEEQYQPLVEETTAYGNKVQIPQSLQLAWKYHKSVIENMVKQYGQEKAVGLMEKRKLRGKSARDLRSVLLEKYEE